MPVTIVPRRRLEGATRPELTKLLGLGGDMLAAYYDPDHDRVIEGSQLDISAHLEDSPSNGELTKAPTSNWAYDHNAEVTTKHLPDQSGSAGKFLTTNGSVASWDDVAAGVETGATVPGSPTTGQLFLHTPTGRKVLLEYDGTTWVPIISFGSTTLYVDKTDGTDSIDKGGSVDSGAFKTIQYTINQIPGLVGGNVTVNINAESYSEAVVVNGKSYIADYSITLIGQLSLSTSLSATGAGQKGATTTQPTFVQTGLSAGAHNNKLLKFTSGSNNGLYRVIDTNNTTTLTLCGPTLNAAPATNDTAEVYSWGTTVTSITANKGQLAVYLNDLSIGQVSGSFAEVSSSRCTLTASGTQGYIFQDMSKGLLGQTVITCSFSMGSWVLRYAAVGLIGCKVVGWTTWGLYSDSTGQISVEGGTVIDGGSPSGSNICVYVTAQSIGKFWCADVYNVIRNATNGLKADLLSVCYQTGTNSYSGCTSNENAVSGSYGYID